ncbi:MAG TPA: NAD-dependent epimerase/dehydratase family protein [Patescibacteria group bacterium]|nr:NAD-dependent epimerase/dehydratase family protein [Patescibacteria group bacterium]
MKHLIMGGRGFLGNNIAAALARTGEEVIIFDKNCPAEGDSAIQYVAGDFSQLQCCTDIFNHVDILWHLISTTVPGIADQNPAYDMETNVIHTIRLLDLAVKHKIKKVIFFSSGGTVYGIPQHLPIGEKHPTDPISSYGIHKLTIEKFLFLYHQKYDMDYVIARVSNPYGKGQINRLGQGVIPTFYHKILAGEEIEIWGDGKNIRDYIYIDDLVEAALLLAANTEKHKVFNVGSGVGCDLLQLSRIIADCLDKEVSIRLLPSRGCDVPANVLDISRIREVTGWTPRTSLEDGIRKWISEVANIV